jgi:hypothetical protein
MSLEEIISIYEPEIVLRDIMESIASLVWMYMFPSGSEELGE